MLIRSNLMNNYNVSIEDDSFEGIIYGVPLGSKVYYKCDTLFYVVR